MAHQFTDGQLHIIQSAVVMLLRRHSSDNRLCCDNDENDLVVTGIDRFGFVTEVRCSKCLKYMETACYIKWTKEKIHKSQLQVGDHICWHRWYIIWHHAIISRANPLRVIHYDQEIEVVEKQFFDVASKSCSCCDALYRIIYEDSYNANYTTLRAQKLLGEKRYNMIERNCEHFSSWCKTGSANSGQVSIFWASIRKALVTMCLRLAALIILALIQYSHEEFEEEVKDRKKYEIVEKVLICIYLVGVTMIFAVHLLITSCSRLAVHSSRTRHDIEKPCSCVKLHGKCTDGCCKCWAWRCICCSVCSCWSLCCEGFLCLFTWCKHIKCSPFTCCQRPGNIACGVFFRIFLREIVGLICTVLIVVFEDQIVITDSDAIIRTTKLTGWILAAQVGGYAVGACLGRLFEAFFESSECLKAPHWRRTGQYESFGTTEV